jgi:hypothetical protein
MENTETIKYEPKEGYYANRHVHIETGGEEPMVRLGKGL